MSNLWVLILMLALVLPTQAGPHVRSVQPSVPPLLWNLVVHEPKLMVSAEQRDELNLVGWPDSAMGFVSTHGGRTIVAYSAQGIPGSNAAKIVRAQGTLDNLVLDGVSRQAAADFKEDYDYYAGGKVYKDPSSGMLLLFAHAEHWYQGNIRTFQGMAALARSTDNGLTWHDLGPIIKSRLSLTEIFEHPNIGAVAHPNRGVDGDSFVLSSDGQYFMMYFTDRATIQPTYTLSVARARIEDVVAAAHKGIAATWYKYYDGAWTEPGLGGRSTPLNFDRAVGWGTSVAWSATIQRYVCITGQPWVFPGITELWMSTDGIAWLYYGIIPQGQYTFVLGRAQVGFTNDFEVTGDVWYLYYWATDLLTDRKNVWRQELMWVPWFHGRVRH